ncbi:MAG: PaREP1 family protein [Nitrososphaerota archaeon]
MVISKTERIRVFLKDARDFLDKGLKEFEEALKVNDNIMIRDAAEKLWNAVISAANALILSYLDSVPASHWERRKLLEKLEDLSPDIEKLGLRDKYGARERYLHEMTFYDGIIDIEMLRREIGKVKEYIEDVEKLLKAGEFLNEL